MLDWNGEEGQFSIWRRRAFGGKAKGVGRQLKLQEADLPYFGVADSWFERRNNF